MTVRWLLALVAFASACTPNEPAPRTVAPKPPTTTSALAGPPLPERPEDKLVPAPVTSAAWPPTTPVAWTCTPPCAYGTAEPTCAGCGGRWDVGLVGIGHCACPAEKGGAVCKDSIECLCELPWELGLGFDKTYCDDQHCFGPRASEGIPLGRCALYDQTFGCRSWIATEKTKHGLMRTVRSLCRD